MQKVCNKTLEEERREKEGGRREEGGGRREEGGGRREKGEGRREKGEGRRIGQGYWGIEDTLERWKVKDEI